MRFPSPSYEYGVVVAPLAAEVSRFAWSYPYVVVRRRSAARGQQVSHVVAGLADKATGQPMQPQDRVHIGSITKTFVATVVLQLAAEGRLSLNDSL